MKDFKDNLDEESIDEEGIDRFASTTLSRTFVQKAVQVLSRYSLLIIVGLAALSITLLHFQGKYLLQALRGTPLPTFWLEKVMASSVVPDKTEVYQQVLAEEARDAWQDQITKPHWQSGYQKNTEAPSPLEDSVVVKEEPLAEKSAEPPELPIQKKRKRKHKPVEEPLPVTELAPSFFQPVRAVSDTVGTSSNQRFISCVVHGDQEVGNRKRMVLRLTEAATVNDREAPVGTLVYGMARLAQDRIQVSVSRVGTQAVSYQVHDHTYHEGITLDERDEIVQDAAKETAYRQGRRRSGELPTDIASDLARDLLGRARRRQPTIFLPDGYPLYLTGQ